MVYVWICMNINTTYIKCINKFAMLMAVLQCHSRNSWFVGLTLRSCYLPLEVWYRHSLVFLSVGEGLPRWISFVVPTTERSLWRFPSQVAHSCSILHAKSNPVLVFDRTVFLRITEQRAMKCLGDVLEHALYTHLCSNCCMCFCGDLYGYNQVMYNIDDHWHSWAVSVWVDEVSIWDSRC